jgi:hypothetical protein
MKLASAKNHVGRLFFEQNNRAEVMKADIVTIFTNFYKLLPSADSLSTTNHGRMRGR